MTSGMRGLDQKKLVLLARVKYDGARQTPSASILARVLDPHRQAQKD